MNRRTAETNCNEPLAHVKTSVLNASESGFPALFPPVIRPLKSCLESKRAPRLVTQPVGRVLRSKPANVGSSVRSLVAK